eukprot:TRINITY_DN64157_c0_g1_i1.p1 TRINITY_DN64157_c0_g1~~TRINITY_DN64157_c0_g1_i1.p1  ORF type:complete len:211 (+),score=31.90 TRINITY_DN64157_c0_g1_i1:68-634(+)
MVESEVRSKVITKSLAREFDGLFPGRDLVSKPHTIVTLSLRTSNPQTAVSSEMLEERTEKFGILVKRMEAFQEAIHVGGRWCDFIDPSTGAPSKTDSSTTLIECDEVYRRLGFEVLELGCCRAVTSVRFGQYLVLTSAFVEGTAEEVHAAMSLLEGAPSEDVAAEPSGDRAELTGESIADSKGAEVVS